MGKGRIPEVAFGLVLKELRGKAGISQERLAFECSLDRTYISLLERGLRQPTLTTMIKLAKALNAKLSELASAIEKKL